jgi:hypothetical protein
MQCRLEEQRKTWAAPVPAIRGGSGAKSMSVSSSTSPPEKIGHGFSSLFRTFQFTLFEAVTVCDLYAGTCCSAALEKFFQFLPGPGIQHVLGFEPAPAGLPDAKAHEFEVVSTVGIGR